MLVEATYCPNCGSAAVAGEERCRTCGARLASGPARAPMTGASPRPEAAIVPRPYVPAAYPQQQPGAPAPGYGWPSGPPGAAGYLPSPYPYPGGSPAPQTPGGYPWPYYAYPAPAPQRRPKGETYALVIAWIATVGGGLSVLGGLLVLAVTVIAALGGTGDSLALLNTLLGFTVPPIIGGILALVYGIGRIRRLPGRRLSVPSPWLFGGLSAAALGAGVVLWNLRAVPGPALAVLPLAVLSGVLPALAIVFLGAKRLGQPTTGRHFWLSLFYGATVAPLLAAILELILVIIVVSVAQSLGYSVNSSVTNLTSSPRTTAEAVILFLVLAVVAPIVEEGLKPLGAVLIMRRLRTPSEAFLLGLAAGIGFDIVETIGYIGMGEADWISVAIQRLGAGLLHGVGAGMAALGWYYLINGKGIPHRWLRGFGGLAYAVVQHAVFNGSNLLTLIPDVGNLLSRPWYLGALPIDTGTILFFGYYAVILGVLFYVTGRLARGDAARPPGAAATAVPTADAPAPQPIMGGAR